ncbi:hypothetical protein EFA69_01480 [Rufibacter immobilis]|uniref:Lipocalin-like domain-containing protein n=1 Tax=Rufibacter immobilis TaxID=1348778 RepID=A0A3M9N5T6_9BACT|nr:hypothetical protein [Rufibacter immobilis]RNI33119.1 hypothetical protein EFA69_01480 [Rufibacter immobilis]
MKKLFPAALILTVLLAACQTNGDKPQNGSSAENAGDTTPVTLCEFTSTDPATAAEWLVGKWELRGIQSNYVGVKEDEFLTGEQMGYTKTLTFFANGEYEEYVNGKLQGKRQPFNVVGQSLPPVGYQFWFCGENTLVVSNIIVDGATEVFVKQK